MTKTIDSPAISAVAAPAKDAPPKDHGLTFREQAAIHIHAAIVSHGMLNPDEVAAKTCAHVRALSSAMAHGYDRQPSS